MGVCITKPLVDEVKPEAKKGGDVEPQKAEEAPVVSGKESDRSLKRLFDKDEQNQEQEKEIEGGSDGQLKRIPEEQEEQEVERDSAKPKVESEKRELEDEEVVKALALEGGSAGVDDEKVIEERPGTPEISESKSPSNEIDGVAAVATESEKPLADEENLSVGKVGDLVTQESEKFELIQKQGSEEFEIPGVPEPPAPPPLPPAALEAGDEAPEVQVPAVDESPEIQAPEQTPTRDEDKVDELVQKDVEEVKEPVKDVQNLVQEVPFKDDSVTVDAAAAIVESEASAQASDPVDKQELVEEKKDVITEPAQVETAAVEDNKVSSEEQLIAPAQDHDSPAEVEQVSSEELKTEAEDDDAPPEVAVESASNQEGVDPPSPEVDDQAKVVSDDQEVPQDGSRDEATVEVNLQPAPVIVHDALAEAEVKNSHDGGVENGSSAAAAGDEGGKEEFFETSEQMPDAEKRSDEVEISK